MAIVRARFDAAAEPITAAPIVAVHFENGAFGALGCSQEDEAPFERPRVEALVDDALAELYDRARVVAARENVSEALVIGLVTALTRGEDGADAEAALTALLSAPDRHMDGFDLAAAAIAARAARLLVDGEIERAVEEAQRATAAAPQLAWAHLLEHLVRLRAGDAEGSRDALRRAHAIDPSEPAIALELGLRLAQTSALADAAEALGAYLESYPNDRVVAGRAARLETQRDLERDFSAIERGGITLSYPRSLAQHDAAELAAQIEGALRDAAQLTSTSPRDSLRVVVYENRADLLGTTCATSWTAAVFDGTLRLHLGLLENELTQRQTVRHESTHAQLASIAPSAPTWLHEGLAQHIGGERFADRARTLRAMREEHTYVPLPSLEGSFMVIEDSSAARFAYDQSLAMVEALIDRDRRSMARAVATLREGSSPVDLAATLGLDGDALLAYAQRVR